MNFEHPLLTKAGGYAIYSTLRRWMSTVNIRARHLDPSVDPANPHNFQPGIYVFWHEYISIPFYLRGNCNIAMLLSRHRDAEWLSHAAKHMGFDTVRGSSNRGGVAALKELFRRSETMHLAITPDGPRGPRRKLAQGSIYLSSKLQLPLIPLGFGFDRPWRMRTWDQFAVPRPFSHARAIMGPRVQIPPNIDRDGIEHYRQHTENLLNYLTEDAEAWARSRQAGENDFVANPLTNSVASKKIVREQDPFWKRAIANFQLSEALEEDTEDVTILPINDAA